MAGATPHASPTLPGAAFNRLDSGSPPQVLSHTPQKLDVGVQDARLGWVEIRAHAAEGQIRALVSTPAASHPALAAQLPALRDYLASHQVRVHTLNAEPHGGSAGGRRNSSGQQKSNGGGSGTSGEREPLRSGPAESEPESLSWVDVRV